MIAIRWWIVTMPIVSVTAPARYPTVTMMEFAKRVKIATPVPMIAPDGLMANPAGVSAVVTVSTKVPKARAQFATVISDDLAVVGLPRMARHPGSGQLNL